MRVSLFITCYNDTLFPATGKAVVRVLERLGHTVDFPLEQTCCGQMHYNTGYQREAMPLMRRFVEIFRDAEAVCIPSSSCVAMIRDHYQEMVSGENQAQADAVVIEFRQYAGGVGIFHLHHVRNVVAVVITHVGDELPFEHHVLTAIHIADKAA